MNKHLHLSSKICDQVTHLPQFMALSRTSTPQILPPQNNAIARMDSVSMAAYKILKPLSLINLHIFMFSKKCVNSSKPWLWEICIIRYTKLMVVHYASRFMQRIGKKRTRLQFHHTNYVCFDAYKTK